MPQCDGCHKWIDPPAKGFCEYCQAQAVPTIRQQLTEAIDRSLRQRAIDATNSRKGSHEAAHEKNEVLQRVFGDMLG